MKKRNLVTKCIYITTKKTIPFYSFLALGLALFFYLTLTTQIETTDGIKTLLWLIFTRAGRGL